MLLTIHLLVVLICALECAFALRHVNAQIARLMIFGPLGLIHGLVPIVILDHAWDTPAQLLASQMALLGIAMLSAGWRLYEHKRPQRWAFLSPALSASLQHPKAQRSLRWIFVLSAVLSVGAWITIMILLAGSIQAAWAAGRFEHRGTGTLFTAILTNIYTNFVLVPGFLGFFLPRFYRLLGIAFTLIMAILLFVGSKGTRGTSIGLLVCLMVGYALSQPLKGLRVFLLGIVGVATIMISSALYEVRKVMQNATYGELVEILLDPEVYKDTLRRDPLNYHDFLISAVEVFPRRHEYLDGATYIRILLFAVPQSLSGGLKPADTHMVFANALSSRRTEMTIPPTMMGDGYINFWGWPGVIIVMLFNGVFFAFMTGRMRDNIWIFLGFGTTFGRVAVMSLRGQPYEIAVGIAISLVLMLAIGRATQIPLQSPSPPLPHHP